MSVIPDQISTRLLKGEQVIWWGRPAQGIMLTARDGLLIPFSLFWGGFAIFWESSVLKTRAPFPFALFGIPFVLVGLFLIFGRFLLDSWLRSRMVYALTDRRVLIARSAPWPSFKSVNLDRLPEATLSEGANGRGTIKFALQGPMWGRMGNGETLGHGSHCSIQHLNSWASTTCSASLRRFKSGRRDAADEPACYRQLMNDLRSPTTNIELPTPFILAKGMVWMVCCRQQIGCGCRG